MAYHSCKNCDYPFGSSYKFCPNCGMKSKDKLTLSVLFYNTINNYLLYDSKFFKSFLPLMIKPGFLPDMFIKGKRLSYLHPAHLYLFVTFIFFFMFSFVTSEQAESLNEEFKTSLEVVDAKEQYKRDSIAKYEARLDLMKSQPITGHTNKQIDSIVNKTNAKNKNQISLGFDNAVVDSLIANKAEEKEIFKVMGMDENPSWFDDIIYPQLLKFLKKQNAGTLLKSFVDATPIAFFVLLPIFALFLKLFYFKKGPYVNHLVFTFYFFAFLFVVFNILFLLNIFIEVPVEIDLVITLSTFIYFYIASKRFYKQGWILNFIKTSVITLVFLAMVVPFAFVVLGLLSFMFY